MAKKTTAKGKPAKSPSPPRRNARPVRSAVKPAPARPTLNARGALAAAAQRPALTEDDLRKCRSGLGRRDLERYRALLMTKRAEILGDVDSIQTDARNKNAGGNLSNMPLHMADVGTDNYDQEFNLSLVESERKLLREINDALVRIGKGYFGVCVESGKPIGKARLDAKPWARYCIDVAREKERRGEAVL